MDCLIDFLVWKAKMGIEIKTNKNIETQILKQFEVYNSHINPQVT